MVKIKDIKVIKEIGSGMIGTTYLVKDKKNNKYALKIEKIFEKDIKKSLKSNIWREIEFSNNLGKKYPDQFMYLYNYQIIKNCSNTQE